MHCYGKNSPFNQPVHELYHNACLIELLDGAFKILVSHKLDHQHLDLKYDQDLSILPQNQVIDDFYFIDFQANATETDLVQVLGKDLGFGGF